MTLGKMKDSKSMMVIVSLIVLYLFASQMSNINKLWAWVQTTQRVSISKTYDDGSKLKNSSNVNKAFGGLGKLKKRLPGCIIIGTKKSGTSALIEFLDIHPNIKAAPNESHFFTLDRDYKKGIEFYRQQMPESFQDQITIEKSPSYFQLERSMKRIHDFNPGIKLLVILRNPVKRMISDFWHEQRRAKSRGKPLPAELTFEQLAFNNQTGQVNKNYEAVIISSYYIHIKRYLEYFPRHHFHVVDGDNFIHNPIEEIFKVENFLGLEHLVTKDKVYFDENRRFFCFMKGGAKQCLRPAKGHIHPQIATKYLMKLNNFFEPLNRKLYELIRQDFNWH